jgi:hypothetical protein
VSGVSKTPKIIAQLESKPDICPHKGRAKRTLSAPTVADVVARALTRACKLSSTSQSAGESTLNPGTDPAPLQPTAYTCPRPNYVPTAQMCASNNTATYVSAQNWCAQLQPLPRAPCALKAHGFGPFGPSGAARALSADSIATRVSAASRALADCSWYVVVLGPRSTAPG